MSQWPSAGVKFVLSFFLRRTVELQQVEGSWPVAVDVPAVLRKSRCITVVLIKIEMDVSDSSWEGRDSLSP